MIGKLSISNLPAVKFDGVWRVLGCLPSDPVALSQFPLYRQGLGALDSSQWREGDLEWLNLPILDQGQTSSCVGHCAADGMHACYKQSGRQLVRFAPYFTYGLINHGRDAGAQISDAMTALLNSGICPLEDLPPGIMFQNQFPQKAIDNAKRFKLEKAFHCPGFEDICSAISNGFVVPLGLMVGQNFSQLDSDGVAPLPMGGGGGHCILGMGLKKSMRYGWLIKTMNSWGPRFGMNGYCYIHKGHLQAMAPDAFAIQSVMDDPLSTDPSTVPVVT